MAITETTKKIRPFKKNPTELTIPLNVVEEYIFRVEKMYDEKDAAIQFLWDALTGAPILEIGVANYPSADAEHWASILADANGGIDNLTLTGAKGTTTPLEPSTPYSYIRVAITAAGTGEGKLILSR